MNVIAMESEEEPLAAYYSEMSWLNKVYQRLVISALRRMNKGYLILTLPDATVLTIGQPNASFQAEMTLLNAAFFEKLVFYGHIGIGEAYMAGDWETPDLTAVIKWAIFNMEQAAFLEGAPAASALFNLLGLINRGIHRLRANSLTNSRHNIEAHYDLSNDFFALFLDETMTYSSARFMPGDTSQTLEAAQLAKYEGLCQKIKLNSLDHVLEIGSGWGGMAIYMAQTYGCLVTTVTISQAQYDYAQARIAALGLTDRITLLLTDYRNLTGTFDKIVSIEMLEAVGDKYFEPFFAQCSHLLKPYGLLGIQYITCPDSRYKLLRDNVDFIQKHIFPGSLLPSIGRVNEALNKTSDLFLYTLEDMGNSYAKTLAIWRERFTARLPEVMAQGFDASFIRKWTYYLSYCEAAFAMRNISVVQAVYTRPNNLLLAAAYL